MRSMARGVKARLTSRRSRVCAGGSCCSMNSPWMNDPASSTNGRMPPVVRTPVGTSRSRRSTSA
jgi:hypothetical protein